MLDLIQAYENYLIKVKQASSNTVSSYIRDVRQFDGWMEEQGNTDILSASRDSICAYLSSLQSAGKSSATVSRTLASLKNFYA